MERYSGNAPAWGRLVYTGLVVMLLSLEAAFAQQYDFQRLGSLSGGIRSTSSAISDNGSTAGGSAEGSTASFHAFRWMQATRMEDLNSEDASGLASPRNPVLVSSMPWATQTVTSSWDLFTRAGQFHFTPIAETAQESEGAFFWSFHSYHGASIDDAGRVAFIARLKPAGMGSDSEEGIFIGQGGETKPADYTRVVDDSEGLTSFDLGDFTDAGVAFMAWTVVDGNGTKGIFAGNGGGLRTLFLDPDAVTHFASTPYPTLNNSGQTALIVNIDDQPPHAIVREPGNDTLYVAEWDFRSGAFQDFHRIYNLAINDGGEVIFVANQWINLSEQRIGLFRGSGGGAAVIFREPQRNASGVITQRIRDVDPDLNHHGQAVFVVTNYDAAGGFISHTLHKGGGGALETLVETTRYDQPHKAGRFREIREPAINDRGDVAFEGYVWRDNTSSSVLSGLFLIPADSPTPEPQLVLGVGDTLFGLEVTHIAFRRYGLNNQGQLAFRVSLRDPATGVTKEVIVRTDPSPCPVITWDGGGDGTSFSDSLNWAGDRLPGNNDIARFDTTSGSPAVQLSADAINTGLTVADLVQMDLQGHLYGLTGECGTPLQVNGSGQLTLEDGTLRTLVGDVQLGPSEAPELIARDGGTVEMAGVGTFRIAAGDTARVSVLTDGRLQLGDNTLVVGDSTYPGRLLVQAPADSTVVRTGKLIVGQGNDGIVRIEGGGLFTERLQMGELVGAEGRLTVFGRGSGLVIADKAEIGIRGTGRLTVHSFGRLGLLLDEWVLGVEAGGDGTLELIAQSELVSVGGSLVISDRGQGHLAVLDGSRAEDVGLVWVGRQQGSAGSITVGAGYPGGSPSRMTVDGMCVGCGGAGVVGVDSVSLLQVNRLQVGPLGIVRGPVLALTTITPPSPSKHASAMASTDSIGLVVEELIIQGGAMLEVDAVRFDPGGRLGGSGTFPFDLTNRGVVAPGDSVGLTDTLTVQGSYIQTGEGALEVELGEPADLLLGIDVAQLDGTLRIALASGFTPQVGDSFVVLQASSVVNEFQQVETPVNIEVNIGYEADRVVVVVSNVITAVDEPTELLPQDFALRQNYPNPFNPETSIEFTLPVASQVRLVVYDLLGRAVKTLVSGHLTAGYHTVQWDGRDEAGRLVASGLYLYRLETERAVLARRLVLMR